MRLDILKHRFTVSYIDESEDFTTLCSDANWITALDDMIRNSQTVDNVTYRVFDTNLNMTAFYIKADTLRHNTSVLPLFLKWYVHLKRDTLKVLSLDLQLLLKHRSWLWQNR